MRYISLGNTGLKVSRTSFGALPIQRCSNEESTRILRRAYDAGINFYDTAKAYTDSEYKIGEALSDVRDKIIIATKSFDKTRDEIIKSIDSSLKSLKTDYIDLFQFHNHYPSEEEIDTIKDEIKKGKVLHMGLTLHMRNEAFDAVRSGLFETLQFPFSSLSDETDEKLVRECKEAGVGFIAMKALSGGLMRNIEANFAFINSFGNIVPIYGIQKMEELEEFIALEEKDPKMTSEFEEAIAKEKKELEGRFCRGCGYCMPCPVEIPLFLACRMDLFLTRSPGGDMISKEMQEKMERITECTNCKACAEKCPYGIEPYNLIPDQLKFYREFVKEHANEIES